MGRRNTEIAGAGDRRKRWNRACALFGALFLVVAGGAGALAAMQGWEAAPPPEEVQGEKGRSDEAPSPPRGESDEGVREPESLPGRDDPEEFYKKPPRKPKRLVKLHACAPLPVGAYLSARTAM